MTRAFIQNQQRKVDNEVLSMSRKYLEEIIPKEKIFGYHDETDERHERWLRQEEEYGFNDIETWDLDCALAQILYERLMMYKEIGGEVVDLSYRTIDIFDTTLKLSECIDLMIEKCKMAIKEVDPFEYTKHMDTVWKIMKEVHGLLWW